jgi:hypothetical protein
MSGHRQTGPVGPVRATSGRPRVSFDNRVSETENRRRDG